MTKLKLISALALSVAVALPAAAAPGTAITTEQVAAAMSGAGINISAEQVTFLTNVVAATTAPALTVESMEPWGGHRIRVRLDCTKREDCLPFFVAVQWDQLSAAQPLLVSSDRARSTAKPDAHSIVLRAGSHATLLLDGDHVHIQLSVVCLENGAPGQTIRVTSPDRKQTYTAQVVDSAVVRGKL